MATATSSKPKGETKARAGNGGVVPPKSKRFGQPNGNKPGYPAGVPQVATQLKHAFAQALIQPDRSGKFQYVKQIEGLLKRAANGHNAALKILWDRLLEPGVLSELEAAANRAMAANRDFLRFRAYLKAFDIQQKVLLTKAKQIILKCGRRAGKTETWALLLAVTIALGERGLYIGKTITVGVEQIYQRVLDHLKDWGVELEQQSRAQGFIRSAAGGECHIRGNATSEEREKLRGDKWHLAIIDECQSQAALTYLITDIVEPMLADYGGVLGLSGTGPRVRGTYWEALWLSQLGDGQTARSLYPRALRLAWDMRENPYIPNAEETLENIRVEHGWTEHDSTFQREYLGEIAYDDDALVLRATEANKFEEASFVGWVDSQPVTDVRLVGGLDYGYEDADAFVILAYSFQKPERWVLYEYKARRETTSELVEGIQRGISYVEALPGLARITNKRIDILADPGGGGKKITADLYNQYHLSVYDVSKTDTEARVELLQDEWRRGFIKCDPSGPLWDESLKTVFKRNDRDELTREIDDETYHPDAIPALRYALSAPWARRKTT